MTSLIEKYLGHLRVRNFSEETIGLRRKLINYFRLYCEDRDILDPKLITCELIERYQRYLYHYRRQDTGGPLTFDSQHSRLAVVKFFLSYLTKQKKIPFNPASEIEPPKKSNSLPTQVLTIKEAEKIMEQPDLNTPFGIRDRAILETFYSTGIRRMEIRNIHLYDIDLKGGILTIKKGKGGKDRVIPIGSRATWWIEKYILEVRPYHVKEPDNQVLFITRRGDQPEINFFTHIVRTCVVQAGIEKHGSCHMFRHTAATLMLEGGADIRYVQELLGHKCLSTTQIYTKVSIQKLKEVHTKTHPAGKTPGGRGKSSG